MLLIFVHCDNVSKFLTNVSNFCIVVYRLGTLRMTVINSVDDAINDVSDVTPEVLSVWNVSLLQHSEIDIYNDGRTAVYTNVLNREGGSDVK